MKVSTVNKQGENLVGFMEIPGEGKYPTVLLVHGFGVTKEEGGMFTDLAELLCKEGFCAVSFDLSGRGESEGDYSETTLTKLSIDVQSILDFLRKHKSVGEIGVLGQSLGTATLVATKPDVRSMVLMGSIAHVKDVLAPLFIEYHPDGISIRKNSSGDEIRINPPFWKDIENHDLIKNMAEITCPVLFIHGEKDEKVPLSEMKAYYEACQSKKENLILSNALHSLRPMRAEMQKAVLKWFKETLQ